MAAGEWRLPWGSGRTILDGFPPWGQRESAMRKAGALSAPAENAGGAGWREGTLWV